MLHLVFLEIDIYQQTRNKHPDGYAQNRQAQPDSNGMPRRDTSIQLSVIEIIIHKLAKRILCKYTKNICTWFFSGQLFY